MNKVFVSGVVMKTPILKMESGDIPHIQFPIDIRHKSRNGKTHHETYQVNAWYKTALWANSHLSQGQTITIQGYLTQHSCKIGDVYYAFAEITAEEFNICCTFKRDENDVSEEVEYSMMEDIESIPSIEDAIGIDICENAVIPEE